MQRIVFEVEEEFGHLIEFLAAVHRQEMTIPNERRAERLFEVTRAAKLIAEAMVDGGISRGAAAAAMLVALQALKNNFDGFFSSESGAVH